MNIGQIVTLHHHCKTNGVILFETLPFVYYRALSNMKHCLSN